MASVLEEELDKPAAWVLDDSREQIAEVAGSLEAMGYQADTQADIDAIDELLEPVESGAPAPQIIVIDQHWNVELTNLGVLGREDIKISSPGQVGIAIGKYLRGIDELRNSTLVMTSGQEQALEDIPAELNPVISMHKDQIYELQRKMEMGISAEESRRQLGMTGSRGPERTGAVKLIRSLAGRLGLPDEDAPRLAGAKRPSSAPEAEIHALLDRDSEARERIRVLTRIATALFEMYGLNFPTANEIGIDLGFPLREALYDGSLSRLIDFQRLLEHRAGGPLH